MRSEILCVLLILLIPKQLHSVSDSCPESCEPHGFCKKTAEGWYYCHCDAFYIEERRGSQYFCKLNIVLIVLLSVSLAAVVLVFIVVLLIAWYRAKSRYVDVTEKPKMSEKMRTNPSLDESEEGVYYEVS
ncbi:hypothetical protein FGIG_05924 [Fasciola gigantica]|uniref:EGF-like domain-containing protein n=1 Tax=Fasciola gigantica TaxID=46835 RepID=A0A504YDX4_FASGI|nr:hypothetical protein FGIG_05924 [Fasciola gigantica]